MGNERLLYGLIGGALGFVFGFISGLRHNRKLVELFRYAANRANQNTAHLMEAMLNQNPEDKP